MTFAQRVTLAHLSTVYANRLRKESSAENVHALADAALPQFTRIFLGGFDALADAVDLDDLAHEFSVGTPRQVLESLPWDRFSEIRPRIQDSITALVVQVGAREAERIGLSRRKQGPPPAAVTALFNLTNERVYTWIEQYTAQMVVQVNNETRQAIREIITQAFKEGLHPYDSARLVRQSIGLTAFQARAVENFRRGMIEAIERGGGPKLVEALRRRWTLSPVHYPGQLRRERVDEFAQKYRKRLLKWRSENIARTETLRASHMGRQSIWREAVAQGLISPDSQRRWVTTKDDRLCFICRPMDGQISALEGQFEGEYQTRNGTAKLTNLTPPIHPMCFPPGTEVFTADGWKRCEDIRPGDWVWTIRLEDRYLELDRVQHAWAQEFSGALVRFRSRTIDLAVTPDHAMLVWSEWQRYGQGRRSNYPLRRKAAGDVKPTDVFPRVPAGWAGRRVTTVDVAGESFPAALFLRFLGWYLAEGSTTLRDGVRETSIKGEIYISQSKPQGREEVAALARQLFGKVWIGKGYICVPTRSRRLAEWFHGLGTSATKRIPKEFLELSPDLLEALFWGLIGGDGSVTPGNWKGHPEWKFAPEITYSTSSACLVDDVTELALKLGYRVHYSKVDPEPNTFSNGTYTPRGPSYTLAFGRVKWSRAAQDRIPYTGPVYGIQMEKNPSLLVRQGGKTLWVGNCRCHMELVAFDPVAEKPPPEPGADIEQASNFLHPDVFPLAGRGGLPLARGASWADLSDPNAREVFLDLVRKNPSFYKPDFLISEEAVEELLRIATDPRFQLRDDLQAYFGISETWDTIRQVSMRGDLLRMDGVRSMAFDLPRATGYAGSGGTTFEVVLPKGTRAGFARVFDLPEIQVLPGSTYKIVSATAVEGGGTHVVLRMVDDGTRNVIEIARFKRDLALAAGLPNPFPILATIPEPVVPTGPVALTAQEIADELRKIDEKHRAVLARAERLRATARERLDFLKRAGNPAADRALYAAVDAVTYANQRVARVKGMRRRLMLKAIEKATGRSEPGKLDVKIRIQKELKKKVEEGVEIFQRLIPQKYYQNQKHPMTFRRIEGRAYYQRGADQGVHIARWDDIGIIIHEMGHGLDDISYTVREATRDFLKRRTQGETAQKLRDLLKNKGYDNWEVSRPDAFFHAYVGKVYGYGAWTTEVTSMGLEQIWRDPLVLIDKDFEHFELMWKIITGTL